MVSGGRSTQKTTQRTARVLRAFKGKTHATILDFVDSFHPLAFRHALRRREVYKELGYEVQE
jgi:superfamily II DNA or RNA helicase